MTDTIFCYHCRRYHDKSEAKLIQTTRGQRWRCLKSLSFSRTNPLQRDAFGRAITALNQTVRQSLDQQTLPYCVKEALAAAPVRDGGRA